MKIIHKFISHNNLKKKELKDIINIKRSVWKYSLAQHNQWIFKNLKKKDLHVGVYISNKLIAYTALRLKNKITKNKKKERYYYFDTHVVKKRYRGKRLNNGSKISDLHMNKIKEFLDYKKISSMLLCKMPKFKYYKNNGWKRIFKNQYELNLKKKGLYAFIYPAQNKFNYTKFYI